MINPNLLLLLSPPLSIAVSFRLPILCGSNLCSQSLLLNSQFQFIFIDFRATPSHPIPSHPIQSTDYCFLDYAWIYLFPVKESEPRMEGNSAGGNDVELLCKTLQVEHKLFYFDLKENPRGRYLKISEKTSSTRSTIIVPSDGINWFLDLFNYYVNSDDQEIFSKELQLQSKVFYFDVGENRRGRFLKVSEASMSRNRSTIIVPAGSTEDEGWAAFRNILAEINEASSLFITPNQQTSESTEHIAGLSDDVGAGFISGHITQSAPLTEINVGKSPDLSRPDGGGNNLGFSKVIRADQKRFFCDLGSNNRGHFLKISEVAGSDRSSIILPLSGLKQFHEMVGHFVEITKDKVDGIASANVRTVDSPQR